MVKAFRLADSACSWGEKHRVELNFNSLPFGWIGDVFYSMSNEQSNTRSTAMINRDRAHAALGNEISDESPFEAYTKPDDVPFLNLFCDALAHGTACNSQKTLDYIGGSRLQQEVLRVCTSMRRRPFAPFLTE